MTGFYMKLSTELKITYYVIIRMKFIFSKTEVVLFKWPVFYAPFSLFLFKSVREKLTLVSLKTSLYIT